MSGSPMDPKRLAQMRGRIEPCVNGTAVRFPVFGWVDVAPLLADRDHWEAEAEAWENRALDFSLANAEARIEARKFRSRCHVTAEDVASLGVTRQHMFVYLDKMFDCEDATEPYRSCSNWYSGDEWVCKTDDDIPVETVVQKLSECGDAAFDILDEMAKGAAR